MLHIRDPDEHRVLIEHGKKKYHCKIEKIQKRMTGRKGIHYRKVCTRSVVFFFIH